MTEAFISYRVHPFVSLRSTLCVSVVLFRIAIAIVYVCDFVLYHMFAVLTAYCPPVGETLGGTPPSNSI